MKGLASVFVSLAMVLGSHLPAIAQPLAAPPPALTIGVDHLDLANQQPDRGRVFEYTDFFARDVAVHSGDTLDFRTAPGAFHIVALASDENVARKVYPVAYADKDNDGADLAVGTGFPKVAFGASNFEIMGGSTHGGGTVGTNGFLPNLLCGFPGQSPCSFTGGNDIEVAGPNPGFDASGKPAFANWQITINARPGEYDFFCYIHPGMHGKLRVVGRDEPTTTQAQINATSRIQFLLDQAEGLAAETAANVVRFTGTLPGKRTYDVKVGVGTRDRHVAIDEMFPTQPLKLVPGDRVRYLWDDPHNIHSVVFPIGGSLPEPFGFDCGTRAPGYIGIPPTGVPSQVCVESGEAQPEGIGDPGNAPPGTALVNPTLLVDAGIHVGTAYEVNPSSQSWSVVATNKSAAGSYRFQCTVHDWMQGTLNVAP